jgi:hypothetical protein
MCFKSWLWIPLLPLTRHPPRFAVTTQCSLLSWCWAVEQ